MKISISSLMTGLDMLVKASLSDESQIEMNLDSFFHIIMASDPGKNASLVLDVFTFVPVCSVSQCFAITGITTAVPLISVPIIVPSLEVTGMAPLPTQSRSRRVVK